MRIVGRIFRWWILNNPHFYGKNVPVWHVWLSIHDHLQRSVSDHLKIVFKIYYSASVYSAWAIYLKNTICTISIDINKIVQIILAMEYPIRNGHPIKFESRFKLPRNSIHVLKSDDQIVIDSLTRVCLNRIQSNAVEYKKKTKNRLYLRAYYIRILWYIFIS